MGYNVDVCGEISWKVGCMEGQGVDVGEEEDGCQQVTKKHVRVELWRQARRGRSR